eukprot:3260209-Pyramimonas_sp.AAC.1
MVAKPPGGVVLPASHLAEADFGHAIPHLLLDAILHNARGLSHLLEDGRQRLAKYRALERADERLHLLRDVL